MTETTVAVSRRRLSAATVVQISGRVLGALLGVVVAAILARSLSRAAFGELALALTILTLAGTVGDLGINEIAVREMARAPERRPQIAGALAAARLVTGVVLGLIGIAASFALMADHQARLMAVFLMATMPLSAVSGLTVAFAARLRPELVIIPTLAQNVIWLGVVLVVGATGGPLALYGVGAFGAAVAQSAITLAFLAPVTQVSFAGSGRLIAELLKLAWPIGLAAVFVTAYYRIDAVLLFHYRGATANAYYGAAYRVIDVLQILPITISGVLLPFLAGAERAAGSVARAARAFELAVALLVAVALPVVVFGIILAPGLVALVYGGAYHPSVMLLQILLPAFIPICLGYLLISQLILHGVLRPYIAISFAGAVVNIVANVIGIPRWGAPMAAWSTLGTELVVMTAIAAVVQVRLQLRLPWGRVARCLAATATAAIAVWLVRAAPIAVGVIVAALVYPPVLFASRAVSLAEVRSLLSREAAAHA
jgi:O-antigen/teichoic acid export membrane protein